MEIVTGLLVKPRSSFQYEQNRCVMGVWHRNATTSRVVIKRCVGGANA